MRTPVVYFMQVDVFLYISFYLYIVLTLLHLWGILYLLNFHTCNSKHTLIHYVWYDGLRKGQWFDSEIKSVSKQCKPSFHRERNRLLLAVSFCTVSCPSCSISDKSSKLLSLTSSQFCCTIIRHSSDWNSLGQGWNVWAVIYLGQSHPWASAS